MKIMKQTTTGAEIEISIDQLKVLINSIRETCKCIGDFGFSARIGSHPPLVMSLVNLLFRKLENPENNSSILIELSLDNLFILHNTLNEICHGFRLNDFESKIGVSREQAKDFLRFINNLIKKIELTRVDEDCKGCIERDVYLDKAQLSREKVCLETQGYQVSFYLKMSSRYVDWLDLIVVMDANAELGNLRFQTSLAMAAYRDMIDLTQYLEQHLKKLQKNPGYISPPFFKNMNLFKIQALAINWTNRDEETFTLQFMLTAFNIKKQDNIETYAGAESRISFQKARDFISSMRAAIAKFSQNPET
jgi:hypothetical protein